MIPLAITLAVIGCVVAAARARERALDRALKEHYREAARLMFARFDEGFAELELRREQQRRRIDALKEQAQKEWERLQ